MADLHEITFTWPDASPHTVIVTGTFDQWSSSIHLTKGASDFSGTAQIPWESTVEYKFIVDGHWTTRNDQPTTTDPAGNVNNIYHSPPKPAPEPVVEKVEQAVVQEEAPVEKQSAPVDIAPEVPVTILPVNVPTDAPSTHLPLPPATEMEPPVSAEPSHAEPETTVEAAATPDVKASVAAEVAAPADVSATPAPTAEVPSTHTPLPPATDAPPAEKAVQEKTAESSVVDAVASATPAPAAEEPSAPTPASPATDAPPAEKVNGESKTNGTAPIGTPNISQPTTPVAAPLTPTKKQAFPRSESPSSPGSSRFSSIASGRPKRTSSIFGKIKGVFGSPGKKEKEAKEKK